MDLQQLSKVLSGISAEQVDALQKLVVEVDNIYLIGNGGSNAIASHMAVDYTKFLHKKCFVLTATDMMSMLVNDYPPVEVYGRFIEYNYLPNSLAILISSSGNSSNILYAANKCHELEIPMAILTGFEHTNKMLSFSSPWVKFRFWVNSNSYGIVEMTHHSFLHAIV